VLLSLDFVFLVSVLLSTLLAFFVLLASLELAEADDFVLSLDFSFVELDVPEVDLCDVEELSSHVQACS